MDNEPIDNKSLAVDSNVGVDVKASLTDADNKPRELTSKNRLFLQLLSEGKKTLVAYREAGYEGSNHAAYQLRSDLKEELIKVLEAQGVDRAGLMQGLRDLIDLPTREVEISAKTKLQALTLLHKMVEAAKPSQDAKPKITAFIVNNSSAPIINPSDVIDGHIAD